jgi:hypothetical protein
MNSFNINCYCVVLSTDIPNNKKYILSLDKDNIVLPKIPATLEVIKNTNQTLMDYLKDLKIADNDLSLIPQIISLHSSYIEGEDNDINTVYGFLVDYHTDIKDSYWISFEYTEPNKYSNLIFDVIQKL